jgi:hypothetical protein
MGDSTAHVGKRDGVSSPAVASVALVLHARRHLRARLVVSDHVAAAPTSISRTEDVLICAGQGQHGFWETCEPRLFDPAVSRNGRRRKNFQEPALDLTERALAQARRRHEISDDDALAVH